MAKRGAKLGTSVLDLDVDDSAFHSKLSGARIAAEKWTSQTGTSLMKAGKAISGVGDAWTRNLTLPILAAGGAAAHFALNFDTSMRQIVGLAKVPKGEIEGIRASILKMGADIGRSPQDLAEAFYFVASAGFKADEAMKVLEVSAKASATGMGQTQDVAKVLGSVINAYGHANITAAHAGDVLTAAIQDGSAEAADFAGVVGRVAPLAAALGVSFDQVTAALSAQTVAGISADEAATSLVQIFSSLLKPSAQAEAAMQGLGLSSAGLRQELKDKGLLETLRTLEERFAGNETASSAVFGNIRALRGITALLALDTDQLNGIFADTAGALDTLSTAYEDTDGPQRKIDKSMARLQATAITLGADVLPMVTVVLEEVAKQGEHLAKWWGSLDKDTRELVVQMLAWVAIAGPVLLIVGKLATGAGALFKVVGFLAGGAGIPKLIRALKLLRTASYGALGPLGLVVAAEVLATEALKSDIQKAAELEIAHRHGAAAAKVFADAMAETAGDVGKAMEAVDAFLNSSTAVADTIPTRFIATLKTLQAGADKIPKTVVASLKDGAFVVGVAAETMVDPIQEALQKAVTDASKAATDLINALAGTLATGPGQIKDELDALAEALVHPYVTMKRRADLESALANKVIIANLKEGDPKIAAEAALQVQTWLAEYELLAPGALAAGTLVNPALQAGVNSNLAATLAWVQTNVTGPFSNLFDLADVLQSMGYDSLAAYARGIAQANLDRVKRETSAVMRAGKLALGHGFYDEGYGATTTYAKGLADAAWQAYREAAQIRRRVGGFLAFAGSPYYTHSREIGEGVGESWSDALARAIGASIPNLGRQIGDVASTLAANLGPGGMPRMAEIPAPRIPGVAALMSADAAYRPATGIGASQTTIINNEFNLHTDGTPPQVQTAQQAIAQMQRLTSFSPTRSVTGQ